MEKEGNVSILRKKEFYHKLGRDFCGEMSVFFQMKIEKTTQ